LVNYYKILGIENYASLEEIKTAYKDKVRVYHPDVNSSPSAEEITKHLNVAKEALDTLDKKLEYDKQLKFAYLLEIQRLKNKPKLGYWQGLSRKEKKQKMEEAKKLRVKKQYEQSLKQFPLVLRVIGLIVVIAWGLQLFYTHYFVLYNSKDMVYNLLGLTLFASGIGIATNQIYTHYMVKSINQALRFHYEKFATWFFVISLVVGPLSVNLLNQFRKEYHLTNHYEYYDANITAHGSEYDVIIVSYYANGRHYEKKMEYPAMDVLLNNKKTITIKYAKADPRISEIVEVPTFKSSK
jgi:hypothetical protein